MTVTLELEPGGEKNGKKSGPPQLSQSTSHTAFLTHMLRERQQNLSQETSPSSTQHPVQSRPGDDSTSVLAGHPPSREDSGSPIRVIMNPERRNLGAMLRSDEYGGAQSAAPHLQENRVKKQQTQDQARRGRTRGRRQHHQQRRHDSRSHHQQHNRGGRGGGSRGGGQRGRRGAGGRGGGDHRRYLAPNPHAAPSGHPPYVNPYAPSQFYSPHVPGRGRGAPQSRIYGHGVWLPSPTYQTSNYKKPAATKKKKPKGIILARPDGEQINVQDLVPTTPTPVVTAPRSTVPVVVTSAEPAETAEDRAKREDRERESAERAAAEETRVNAISGRHESDLRAFLKAEKARIAQVLAQRKLLALQQQQLERIRVTELAQHHEYAATHLPKPAITYTFEEMYAVGQVIGKEKLDDVELDSFPTVKLGRRMHRSRSSDSINGRRRRRGDRWTKRHEPRRERRRYVEDPNAWQRGMPTDEKEIVLSKVREILNKITPEKFESLRDEFCELRIGDVELLQTVVLQVFNHAVRFPDIAFVYAALCKDLEDSEDFVDQFELVEDDEVVDDPKLKAKFFRRILLNKCHESFRESFKTFEILERSSAMTEDELYELGLKKQAASGNILFIASLFLAELIANRVMHVIIKDLAYFVVNRPRPSEEEGKSYGVPLDFEQGLVAGEIRMDRREHILLLCKLLTKVGRKMDNPRSNKDLVCLNSYMNFVRELSLNPTLSTQHRCVCRDLVELRVEHRWVPPRQEETAKTIQQIRQDVVAEYRELGFVEGRPKRRSKRSWRDSRRSGQDRRRDRRRGGGGRDQGRGRDSPSSPGGGGGWKRGGGRGRHNRSQTYVPPGGGGGGGRNRGRRGQSLRHHARSPPPGPSRGGRKSPAPAPQVYNPFAALTPSGQMPSYGQNRRDRRRGDQFREGAASPPPVHRRNRNHRDRGRDDRDRNRRTQSEIPPSIDLSRGSPGSPSSPQAMNSAPAAYSPPIPGAGAWKPSFGGSPSGSPSGSPGAYVPPTASSPKRPAAATTPTVKTPPSNPAEFFSDLFDELLGDADLDAFIGEFTSCGLSAVDAQTAMFDAFFADSMAPTMRGLDEQDQQLFISLFDTLVQRGALNVEVFFGSLDRFFARVFDDGSVIHHMCSPAVSLSYVTILGGSVPDMGRFLSVVCPRFQADEYPSTGFIAKFFDAFVASVKAKCDSLQQDDDLGPSELQKVLRMLEGMRWFDVREFLPEDKREALPPQVIAKLTGTIAEPFLAILQSRLSS